MEHNKNELIASATNTLQLINQQTDDDKVAIFDPRIKFASKKEEAKASIVWSTKSIELALEAINDGQGLRVSPFLKSNPNLRKPNLLYQYTDEEILEILKCKKDIIYFAEKYVFLKTSNGLQHIKLRPYQKKLLRMYQENRWNITLFPRQAGKCVSGSTHITTLDNGDITMSNFFYINKQHHTLKEFLINVLWKLYNKLR